MPKDLSSNHARTLASNLEKAFAPNMVLWDERFSTAVMQRELITVADMSRSKRAAIIDKLAAAYMLQGALDYLRALPKDNLSEDKQNRTKDS